MLRIMENSVRLRRVDNSLFLDLIGESVSTVEFDIHLNYIKKLKNYKKIFINIAYLDNLDNEILNKFRKMHALLKDRHVCFINVNPMQNSILNLFSIDKMFQLYMNKMDAIDGRKPIVNRQFRVVS